MSAVQARDGVAAGFALGSPMVCAQQYRDLDVPGAESFTPTLPVTVIVPCRESGDGTASAKLALVLASLAAQDYPAELLRVIVADDASPSPLQLPAIAPASTRVVRHEDAGGSWGKSAAFNAALELVDTPLVMSLDADMLLHPAHVRTMARWVHASPLAVVLGWKRMVESWTTDPIAVLAALQSGGFDTVADGPGEPHAWVEETVEATDQLTAGAANAFKVVVGASVLTSTALLRSAGAYDEDMRLAEDTELGYRLAMAGGFVVPEPQARAWHLGLTTMTHHREVLLSHNHALLRQRVPLFSSMRSGAPSGQYLVPAVVVNVHMTQEWAQSGRELVASLLNGALGHDVRIVAWGQWPSVERYRAVDDPQAAMREFANAFAGDPRVECAAGPVEDGFPSPYLLDVRGDSTLSLVRGLLRHLRTRDVGVVATAGEPLQPAEVAAWRTSALSRVRAVTGSLPQDRVARARLVAQAWGSWWATPADAARPEPVRARKRRQRSRPVRLVRRVLRPVAGPVRRIVAT